MLLGVIIVISGLVTGLLLHLYCKYERNRDNKSEYKNLDDDFYSCSKDLYSFNRDDDYGPLFSNPKCERYYPKYGREDDFH